MASRTVKKVVIVLDAEGNCAVTSPAGLDTSDVLEVLEAAVIVTATKAKKEQAERDEMERLLDGVSYLLTQKPDYRS